jgi:alanine dehydrogenase
LSKINKFSKGKYFFNTNNYTITYSFLYISDETIIAVKTMLVMGANINILEGNKALHKLINDDCEITFLKKHYNSKIQFYDDDYATIESIFAKSDVFIATSSKKKSKTSARITKKMICSMEKGSIFLDLAADNGLSSSEVFKHPTTIKKPCIYINGVSCIAIENICDFYPFNVSSYISENITNSLSSTKTSILESEHFKDAIQIKNGKIFKQNILDYYLNNIDE